MDQCSPRRIGILSTFTVTVVLASVLLSGAPYLPGQAEVLKPPDATAPPQKPAPGPERPPPAVQKAGGIAAIINDDVITMAELQKRVAQGRAALGEQYPWSLVEGDMRRLTWFTLRRLIDDKLVLQLVRKEEARNENRPFVTDAGIDLYLKRQVDSMREKSPDIRGVEDLYRIVLERDGLNRAEYRSLLKERIAVDSYLRTYVLRDTDDYVSPEEARIYYRTHLGDFTHPEEIAFRQIQIKWGAPNFIERKEAVEAGIKDGKPFDELAMAYSDEAVAGDAEAAARIWTRSYEDLRSWREPIPEVLRTLKKGLVSGEVRTVRGLHYFKVEDLVEGKPKSFSEMQEEIFRKIRTERDAAELDAFLKGLRKKSVVEILLPRPPDVPPDQFGEGEFSSPPTRAAPAASPGKSAAEGPERAGVEKSGAGKAETGHPSEHIQETPVP